MFVNMIFDFHELLYFESMVKLKTYSSRFIWQLVWRILDLLLNVDVLNGRLFLKHVLIAKADWKHFYKCWWFTHKLREIVFVAPPMVVKEFGG